MCAGKGVWGPEQQRGHGGREIAQWYSAWLASLRPEFNPGTCVKVEERNRL